MSKHAIPHFSNLDGAHSRDGLWVPTNGVLTVKNDDNTVRRRKSVITARTWDGVGIGFESAEKLGANDQSIFLAICAQAAAPDRRQIKFDVKSDSHEGLQRAALNISAASIRSRSPVISISSTLYRIARDAGMTSPGKRGQEVRESLRRLGGVTIVEITMKKDKRELRDDSQPLPDGVERKPMTVESTSLLIATQFDQDTKQPTITINPRQTDSLLRGQKVQISLVERRALKGEVPKLLHFWLCVYTRLGEEHGVNGSGIGLGTLVKHIWHEPAKPNNALQCKPEKLEIPDSDKELEAKKAYRDQQQRLARRRRLIIRALEEINNKTDWEIEIGPMIAHIKRPSVLPIVKRKEKKQIGSDA